MPAAAATGDGLKELEKLSLLSKVCSELDTHLHLGDQVVGQYVIDLGKDCVSVDEFHDKLKDFDMPDYLIRTLFTIIRAILPLGPQSEKQSGIGDGDADTKYKALAIRDSRDKVKELEKELELEAQQRNPRRDNDKDGEDNRNRDRRERHRDRYDRGSERDHRDRGRDRERDYREDDGDRRGRRHEHRSDKIRRGGYDDAYDREKRKCSLLFI